MVVEEAAPSKYHTNLLIETPENIHNTLLEVGKPRTNSANNSGGSNIKPMSSLSPKPNHSLYMIPIITINALGKTSLKQASEKLLSIIPFVNILANGAL